MGVDPKAYAAWRASRLGSTTEELEQRLVFELAGPLEGKRLLDVGCGDGAYCFAAAERGAVVTGIDPSDEMLAAARARADRRRGPTSSWGRGAQIRFLSGDAERLPFADESFDTVLAVTVLCFVREPARALGEIARVLVPGGRLVLGELGRRSVWAAWRRLRGLLGSSTWRSARFSTSRELRRLVEAAGLRGYRTRGAIFYPPIGSAARVLSPLDARLGRITSWGAAFVAVSAVKG